MRRTSRRSPGDIKRLVVAFCIAVVLLGPQGASMAQREGDGRFQAASPYDLPAMTLFPQDYGIEGMRYFNGDLFDTNEYADFMASEAGGDVDTYASQLGDEGFIAAYRLTSTTLGDETDLVIKATAWVSQYEEADGAASGFELAQQASPDGEVVDSPEFGDQSILLVDDAAGGDNDSLRMDYIVLVENVVGAVSMTWSGDSVDDAFTVDEMADVGRALQDRVEDGIGRDTPGLAINALRPVESSDYSVLTYDDGYLQIDGEYVRTIWYNQELQDVADFWDEQGVSAVYWSASELTPSSAGSDGPVITYIVRAYIPDDEDRAERFISESRAYFETGGGNYSGFRDIEALPDLGRNAQGVAYEYNAGTSRATEGYRVWFVDDGVVYSIEMDAPEGVDFDLYLDVVEAQIGCLENNHCRPAEFPADIAQ